jgi:hypothetical protein
MLSAHIYPPTYTYMDTLGHTWTHMHCPWHQSNTISDYAWASWIGLDWIGLGWVGLDECRRYGTTKGLRLLV